MSSILTTMPLYALGDARPTIAPTAFVHPDAVIIGQVTIGAESSVWPSAVLRGDDGFIQIGSGTSIQDGSVLHTTSNSPTLVGDNCVVGHLVHMEGCTVHDNVLVGSGAVVLPEAELQSWSLVGANALVPSGMTIPSKAIAVGTPATIRPDAVVEEMIRRGVESYKNRAKRYRSEMTLLDD